jgi:CHAD domain-containing protein
MDDPRASLHSLSRRSLGPARPVKSAPAPISPAMHPDAAFRATLSHCLAQMTANAATLRVGRSVEGLHQLRVAFRRLEVALGTFGREFGVEWLEELRGRAKILSGRLAPARDLDVFVGKLLDEPAKGQPDKGFAALRAAAEKARDTAWQAAHALVTGADFALFLDDIAALAQSRLPLGRDPRLPRVAARILDRQARRVKKRGRAARSGEAGDLHRLRIALKKLRYTAECFAPLYPKAGARQYLKRLRALQERLGDLNDVANVRERIAELLREDSGRGGEGRAADKADRDLRFAAGLVAGWHGAHSAKAAKKALKRYAAFKAMPAFW